jgi:hypothetical protein
MKRWGLVLLAVALCSLPVSAVGTVVVTSEVGSGNLSVFTLAWTSSAAGAVSGNAVTVSGLLWQVKFVPNTGATQPTDNYDVTLTDQDGADMLTVSGVAEGSNLSNALPKVIRYTSPPVLKSGGTLDLVVANAGNAKTGTVYLWIQQR